MTEGLSDAERPWVGEDEQRVEALERPYPRVEVLARDEGRVLAHAQPVGGAVEDLAGHEHAMLGDPVEDLALAQAADEERLDARGDHAVGVERRRAGDVAHDACRPPRSGAAGSPRRGARRRRARCAGATRR